MFLKEPIGSCLALVLSACALGAADEPGTFAEDAGSPLCGVYCVYGAAHVFGIPADFGKLADKKYVSEREGSTSDDLLRALSDHSLRGQVRRGMSLSQLSLASGPVILHTRSQVGSNSAIFRHWVLFLGFDDSGAKIYDPPRGTDSITPAELLSIWDGTGILVHRESAVGTSWVPPLEGLAAFALVGCVMMTVRHLKRPVGMLVVWFVSAGIWFLFSIGAGRIDRAAVRNTVGPGDSRTIPEMSWGEIEAAARREEITLVDSRPQYLFHAGRIDGSLNIPMTTGYLRFRQIGKEIPKDRMTVVYCSNEKCAWSDVVAQQLSVHGFSRVRIYRGGYREWRVRGQPGDK